MDIVSWALIGNDPMATERVSLIQFFIVFFGIFISIWYTSLLLAKRVLANPDATAKRVGFRDYNDMHFQITRVSIGIACCFAVTVMLTFFFTNYVDLLEAATKVHHDFFWDECMRMEGAVYCGKYSGPAYNFSLNISSSLFNSTSWGEYSPHKEANATK